MKNILSATAILLLAIGSLAQSHQHSEPCGTQIRHEQLLQSDPDYRQSYEEAQERFRRYKYQHSKAAPILTIPIVVHVIHTGEPVGTGTNISDAQVQSAITALNDDYRKIPGTNGFGAGADTEIEFCLAITDPNGGVTNGINRVDGSSVSQYSSKGISGTANNGASETQVKALSLWPNSDYYNIWIVNEIDDNDGGAGVQGYAYYPGAGSSVDGAVILHNAFGTTGNLKSYTNLNRTATHELGHGLNLKHTFEGDGGGSICPPSAANMGDEVGDTPPHKRSSSNCPTGANACVTGGQLSDVVHNYMDYSSSSCKNEFSAGQATRMRAAIQSTRSSLLNSNACAPNQDDDVTLVAIKVPGPKVCSESFRPKITVRNSGKNKITSFLVSSSIDGGSPKTSNWSGTLNAGGSVTFDLGVISGLTKTIHSFDVTLVNPNGNTDPKPADNSKNTSFLYDPVKPKINLTGNEDLKANVAWLSYKWLRQNQVRPEFTTQQIRPLWDGNYRVIAIESSFCQSDTSDPYPYFLSSIEEETARENRVQLIPNPVTDQLTIQPLETLHSLKGVTLYDVIGNRVEQIPLDQMHQLNSGVAITLNVSHLPAGLYVLQFDHDSVITHQKLSKR